MTTQVSAYISNETKIIFENFSAKTGQKKRLYIGTSSFALYQCQSRVACGYYHSSFYNGI